MPGFAPTTHGEHIQSLAGSFFRTIETRHSAGLRLPRHAHEDAGLTLVLEGAYREEFGDRVFACTAGSVLYKPAAREHADTYGAGGARVLHLEFDGDRRARGDGSPWGAELGLRDEPTLLRGARAAGLAARFVSEVRTDDSASRLAMDGLALELMAEVGRAQGAGRDLVEGRAPWLDRATEVIREEYDRALRLGVLAAEIGVHPVRLARAFRRRHGCSVGQYVRRVRIDAAERLLRETDRPLADVALAVGFCDQAHLARAFGRETGMSPRRYREARRLR